MKSKIFLTGSRGRIGSFLCKKLKKEFTIIKSDIKNGDNLENENYLKNIFTKNKIFAVVFCHGLNSTPLSKFRDKTENPEKLLDQFFKVNFYLNFKVINEYLKYQSKGRIINFSSIYSIKSPKHFIYKNFQKELGYSVSKAASNMMMKYFGTKYGKKFLFNNIILGGVEQKQLDQFFYVNYNRNNPKGRMMKLSEILPTVNFLLDKKNTYMNAQEVFVDGGWLSW